MLCGMAQLTPGPCLSFPPVLLELTSSPHPSHRFTPFQLLDTAPTLLIDSVREPLPISQLASLLLAGMNDPSVDVRVEALKAMRSVILEGVTGQERSEIAPGLIVEAYKVRQVVHLGEPTDYSRYRASPAARSSTPWTRSSSSPRSTPIFSSRRCLSSFPISSRSRPRPHPLRRAMRTRHTPRQHSRMKNTSLSRPRPWRFCSACPS